MTTAGVKEQTQFNSSTGFQILALVFLNNSKKLQNLIQMALNG